MVHNFLWGIMPHCLYLEVKVLRDKIKDVDSADQMLSSGTLALKAVTQGSRED